MHSIEPCLGVTEQLHHKLNLHLSIFQMAEDADVYARHHGTRQQFLPGNDKALTLSLLVPPTQDDIILARRVAFKELYIIGFNVAAQERSKDIWVLRGTVVIICLLDLRPPHEIAFSH
jgi:hypothetical protein